MPEIRRLETEELLQLRKIHTIVYNQRKDYSKEENQKLDPYEHPADWAWGFFDGKKLLAGMFEVDYLMRFDGHSVKMSGISGVGTLPEMRKGGLVRQIFGKLLPEAYEKGVVFSNLTPFSHDFYRKFGYEITCVRNSITISTGDLSEIRMKGEFTHILPGDDTSLLAEVHSAYIENINHGIHRDYWPDNRAWKIFTKDDPYTTGTYLYLWKDENGKASSYIKYHDVVEDGDHNMSVYELAFINKKGLYGALSIAGGLSAQFQNFKWLMPAFIDPFDFTGDAWSVETELKPRDMTRIINVKTALELMRRPHGEGEYIIKVTDDNISANSGKYLVQFGAEGAKVSVTSKNEDLSCDILTLSQLVTGYRSLENAMYSRSTPESAALEVIKNEETLKRVFTLRPQHVTEYF
ncbi:MAG: GNAT family N-acetyltransferase [Treponema sp.]|nr:GNAT family N-acetyltransferase [Treponema sp.]